MFTIPNGYANTKYSDENMEDEEEYKKRLVIQFYKIVHDNTAEQVADLAKVSFKFADKTIKDYLSNKM